MSLKTYWARYEVIKFNNKVPLSIYNCELCNQVISKRGQRLHVRCEVSYIISLEESRYRFG